MEIALIRLMPPATGPRHAVGAEVAVDLLWAAALPDDRLEHIRARPGPDTQIDLALFHRPTASAETALETAAALSIRLCRRAIKTSPALAGWNVALLTDPVRTHRS